MDGFEVLRRLRARHIPSRVLVLTARREVKDRVAGLQLGADDYLPKPFAMQELVARVRALGRRFAEEPPLNLRVGDLTFDLANHEVFRGASTNRVVGTRTNVVKGPDARAEPRLHPHGIMRARVGTRPRIRHQAGRGFHRTVAQKNW